MQVLIFVGGFALAAAIFWLKVRRQKMHSRGLEGQLTRMGAELWEAYFVMGRLEYSQRALVPTITRVRYPGSVIASMQARPPNAANALWIFHIERKDGQPDRLHLQIFGYWMDRYAACVSLEVAKGQRWYDSAARFLAEAEAFAKEGPPLSHEGGFYWLDLLSSRRRQHAQAIPPITP